MSLIGDMEKVNIDNMKCGMFNNKSYWGYKSSVLKSGVEKIIVELQMNYQVKRKKKKRQELQGS